MKKKIMMICLVLACVLVFTGCCFHKEWYAASCTSPKTCAECGETEGEALGHTWADATCTAPKTCSTCNLTEGEALGHVWQEATTEAPKTCSTCAVTEGERIITDARFTTAATAEIQGAWACEIAMTDEMLGYDGLDATLNVQCNMEMGNDGTLVLGYQLLNEDEFCASLKSYLEEMLYAELEAVDISREDADQSLQDVYGMTVAEYAQAIVDAVDYESVFSALCITGVYYVEDGQFYSGLSWDSEMGGCEFTLEGDTLLMKDVSGLTEEAMTFTRVTE